jgi:hypothetical protein
MQIAIHTSRAWLSGIRVRFSIEIRRKSEIHEPKNADLKWGKSLLSEASGGPELTSLFKLRQGAARLITHFTYKLT